MWELSEVLDGQKQEHNPKEREKYILTFKKKQASRICHTEKY